MLLANTLVGKVDQLVCEVTSVSESTFDHDI